jgi:uncharacterized membrane protein (DUF4010 family)
VALCLGALVGLERQVAQEEREEKDFPGVRTFAFTSLVGALAVLVSRELGPWLGVSLFLASATFLVLRYRYDASERGDPGYTTEIASLCTFAVGALAQSEQFWVATIITVVMVALLRSKEALHRAGELLSPVDMEVLIRFAVIAGVVFPLLPREAYDPLGVLSPRDVWRVVVLISGISFAGYVLVRVGAGRGGHLITGMLGGLVSSTATALAYARAGRNVPATRRYESLVVLAASTMLVRLAIILAVVNPSLLPGVAPVFGVMFGTGVLIGFLRHRPIVETEEQPTYANPLSMRTALGFAALYAVVLLTSAWAGERFAEAGTYLVTSIAAAVGADAPTLSLARLAAGGRLSTEAAVRGISIVAIVTTLGKVGLLFIFGRGPFVRRVVVTLLCMATAGLAALVYL